MFVKNKNCDMKKWCKNQNICLKKKEKSWPEKVNVKNQKKKFWYEKRV